MSKNSYMDSKSLINEGFLKSLISLVRSKKLRKFHKAANNPKINKQLNDLNKSVDNLENEFKKQFKVDLKLDKFTLKDFI